MGAFEAFLAWSSTLGGASSLLGIILSMGLELVSWPWPSHGDADNDETRGE